MATNKKFNVRHGLSAGANAGKDVVSDTGLVYDVGTLTDLKTTAKSNTVVAINELHDEIANFNAVSETNEPMGVLDRTQSVISFNNTTKTFSIALAAGKTEFVIWTTGIRRSYTTTQSVSIGASPSTGLYYIYFNSSGVLSYKTTYFDWPTETPIAYIYWNATTAKAEFVADERHGIVLDWQTHEYLHRTRGAVIANGFSISAYTTTGDGSVNAHAQFDLSNGTFFDEDLEVNITHSATPTNGTFTQVLTGAAEIPVFYINGSEGAWVRDVATEFACKQSATTLQYNSLSGTTWSTTPATNNRYVISWIVATNDIYAPVIAILGQAEYTDIGGAEAALFGDLVLTNFPIFEFRPLWKVIFRTSTGYTNTPNAYISNVLDLREMSSTGTGGSIVSDHGLLTGLSDDDHSQYLHTTLTRTGVTAELNTTGKITTTNRIGIGITNPESLLDILGNGANTAQVSIRQFNNTDNDGPDIRFFAARGTSSVPTAIQNGDFTGRFNSFVYNGTSFVHSGSFGFQSTGTNGSSIFSIGTNNGTSISDHVVVNGSGNVGIGTTNPESKLHVSGGDLFVNSLDGDNVDIKLSVGTDYNSSIIRSTRVSDIQSSLSFHVSDDGFKEAARLDYDGLTVRGFSDGTTASIAGNIVFSDQSELPLAQIASYKTGVGNDTDLVFGTYDENNSWISEKLRIVAGGNVGIGTDNPSQLLHLNSSTSNQVAIQLQNSNTGGGSWLLQSSGGAANNGQGQFSIYDIASTAYRLVISTSGNIGIGTTNPTSKLYVVGSGVFEAAGGFGAPGGDNSANVPLVAKITNPTGDTFFGALNAYSYPCFALNVSTYTDSSTNRGIVRFYDKTDGNWNNSIVLNTGRVGIGTTNPGSALSVNGYITENPGDGVYWNVVTQKDIGFASNQVPLNQYLGQLAFVDTFSPSGLRRVGGGVDEVVLNPAGLLGIGTTAPQRRLHLYDTGATEFIIEQGDSRPDYRKWNFVADGGTNSTTGNFYLRLLNDAGTATTKTYWNVNGAGNYQSFYDIVVINDSGVTGTASQNLQVTGGGYFSGNVGIGVTNPIAPLDVNGAVSIGTTNKVAIGGDAGRNIEIGVGNSTTSSYIDFRTADNVDADYTFRIERGAGFNGGVVFANKGTGSFSFFSSATETLTLTSTGNLGIGTASPSRKLQVIGTVGIGTAISITPYDTLNNGTLSFEGSAGQLFAIRNNLTSGSIFSVNDVSGIPSIDVDANGTVALTPFGGNVGIGITNPFSKLQVNTNSSSLTYPLDLWNAGTGPLVARLITTNSAGTGTSPFDILKHPNGEHSLRAVDSAGFFTFFTGGYNERIRISATGNVGIGTNNPTHLLQVGPSETSSYSYLKLTGAGATNRFYRYITPANKATASGVADAAQSLYVGRFYNGVHKIQMYVSGNFIEEGLSLTLFREWGVSSVPVITSEEGADLLEVTFHYQNIDNECYHVFINFNWAAGANLGANAAIRFDITSISSVGTFDVPTTPTIPTLNPSNQILQRFLIASSGNVGIGTTNPTARLSLIGGTDPVLDVAQTTSGAARWVIKARTSGIAVNNESGIYQDVFNNLQFAARDGNGVLRVLLDSNSNSGSYINSTGGFAIGTSTTTTGYTSLATNLRLGVTAKAGTYSHNGSTTVTVVCANHGLTTGDSVLLTFDTLATGTPRPYSPNFFAYFNQVTVVNSSTFTVVAAAQTAATGNCTVYPETQLRFPGVYGDANALDHTVISERLWGGADKSELLIFKGNDAGTSIQDNIRLAATGDIYFHSGATGAVYGGYIANHGNTINSSTVSILASGNVGIGITNPSNKLHVSGTKNTINIRNDGRLHTISTPNWNYAGLIVEREASNTNIAKLISFLLDGDVDEDTNLYNYPNLVLRTSSTPTTGSTSLALNARLEITAPIGVDLGVGSKPILRTIATGVQVDGFITESVDSGTTYWNVVTQRDIGFNANQVPLNQYLGQLAFADTYSPSGLRRDGGGTDDVFVSSGGNVGIGLTNPSDRLQVSGTINASSDISLGGELNFYTPAFKYVDFYAKNAAGANFGASLRLVNHDSTSFHTAIYMAREGGVELYTNNSKRFETTSSGILVNSPSLGSTVGNTVTLASFYHNNGNGSYLNFVSTRNTTVQTWAGASTKIVNVTDVTSQGYIEFNPNGSLYGLAFGQGGTEFARFTETANLGIGTTNPTRKLHVVGTSSFSSNVRVGSVIEEVPYDSLNGGTLSWEGSAGQLFSITNSLTTGSIFSVNDVSGIPSIDVDANGIIKLAPFGGNVGIGTTNPTTKLHVIGDILASGNVTAYSDSQLKDNVETIDKPLEKVLGLRGVTFTRVDTEDRDKKHVGVIAQEVEAILPEAVQEHANGIKSVAYGNMVGLLIEAIKEQQNQIETLKTEIESLKRN